MQELTFEQVGIVVGGNGGESGESTDNSSVETDTIKVKQDAAGSGSYGSTVATGIISGSLGATAYKAPNPAAKAIGVVAAFAGLGFSLAREGRDGMRVQNHPATRDLYNADGSMK